MIRSLDIVKLALDIKAENCKLINVEKVSSITDEIFICSADNERQVRAIAENILKHVPKSQVLGQDGMENSRWIILDFGHLIVHIFHEDERVQYNIEGLYTKGKTVPIPTELFMSA